MTGRLQPPTPEELRGFDAFELRLGDVMRGERATLGKSLIDVQRELKIKATYVAAIENADASAFDTPGFIAGYVRSYARYLGLDPEWAWDSFCREAGFQQPHGLSSKASPPKPQRRTGLDALGDPNAAFVPRSESAFEHIELRAIGSLAVLVALIGALGYGAWAVLQEVQRVELAPAEQAPGVIAQLDPLPSSSGPELPEVALEESAGLSRPTADALDRLYRPQALDVPVLVARDGPIAAVRPGSVGALAEVEREQASDRIALSAPADTPDTTGDTVLADATENAAPQVVEGVPELSLVAVRPAWVRVTAADGTVLLEKILEPGERWEVPATEEPPVLRAGNSGAVYFEVNGTTYGPAAPGAQVVKNLALAPAAVAESFAVADVSADPGLADLPPPVPVAQAQAPAP